ncbi:hypothetical protein BT63DRAFT_420371 [Microthyrium microscopicum]|uniref:DUF829-domain-containing protein n=1 Tax=Microthyrium microscopicum TaxID=703497 RepID=A0A6A6US46_9PEZI|nr:hypothetical protein BT63DRAFT_420371 [Microthyrium microscopicum]
MAPERTTRPFVRGFTKISEGVWEYSPDLLFFDPNEQEYYTDAPDLILLFSWTGAPGRPVAKYTEQYQKVFPTSTIIIITTSLKDLAFRSSELKQANLQKLIDHVLNKRLVDRILVHAFSEGGSNKAVEFAEAYGKRTGTKLPVSAIVLDSTPGLPRFGKTCEAFVKSLPMHNSWPVWLIGWFLAGLILGIIWGLYCGIKGYHNNVISKTRRRLNDQQYWNLETSRCYLYSKSDELIHWEDIKSHAEDANERGIPVWSVCFDTSLHCRHEQEDRPAYWEAVMRTWERGLKVTNTTSETWSIYGKECAISLPPEMPSDSEYEVYKKYAQSDYGSRKEMSEYGSQRTLPYKEYGSEKRHVREEYDYSSEKRSVRNEYIPQRDMYRKI